jgi:hypothetical protein
MVYITGNKAIKESNFINIIALINLVFVLLKKQYTALSYPNAKLLLSNPHPTI